PRRDAPRVRPPVFRQDECGSQDHPLIAGNNGASTQSPAVVSRITQMRGVAHSRTGNAGRLVSIELRRHGVHPSPMDARRRLASGILLLIPFTATSFQITREDRSRSRHVHTVVPDYLVARCAI